MLQTGTLDPGVHSALNSRILAEQRLGEMLAEQKAVGFAKGTRGQLKGRKASGGAVAESPEQRCT